MSTNVGLLLDKVVSKVPSHKTKVEKAITRHTLQCPKCGTNKAYFVQLAQEVHILTMNGVECTRIGTTYYECRYCHYVKG